MWKLCEPDCVLRLLKVSKRSLERVCLLYPKVASLIPGRATEQNNQLIALVKQLTAYVDDEGQKKIDDLLDSVNVLQ